jgi:hypothetical protein
MWERKKEERAKAKDRCAERRKKKERCAERA